MLSTILIAVAAIATVMAPNGADLPDVELVDLGPSGFEGDVRRDGEPEHVAVALDIDAEIEPALELAAHAVGQAWTDEHGTRVVVVALEARSDRDAATMMAVRHDGFGADRSSFRMGNGRERFTVESPDGGFGLSREDYEGPNVTRSVVTFRCDEYVFHVEASEPTDVFGGSEQLQRLEELASDVAVEQDPAMECDRGFDPLLRQFDAATLVVLLAVGTIGASAVVGAQAAIRRRDRVGDRGAPNARSGSGDIVDVSGLRRRLVTQSLLLTAATIAGFGIVAVRWALDAQHDDEIDSTFDPVVDALVVYVLIRFAARLVGADLPVRIRTTSRVWSGRRRVLTFLLVLAAGLIWIVALLWIWDAIVETLKGVYRLDAAVGQSWAFARYLVGVAASIAAATVFIALARGIYLLADRVAVIDARRALDRDRRPPVLLLRAFDDDDVRIRTRRSARHRLVDRFRVSHREPFERLVAGSLRAVGPVVAIADPRRRFLRPIGAARDVVDTENWREVVAGYMEWSALNVVILGRGEGLRWEIETILAHDPELAQTVFVIPPLADDAVAERWAVLADMLGTEAEPHAGAVAVRVIGGAPLFYDGGARDGVGYEVGLATAARDVVGDVDKSVVSQRQLHAV